MCVSKRLWIWNEFPPTKKLLEYSNDKQKIKAGYFKASHTLIVNEIGNYNLKSLQSAFLWCGIFLKFLRHICVEIYFSSLCFWENTKQRCINHNKILLLCYNLNHFIIIKLHLLQILYRHFANKPTTDSVLLEGK